MLKKAIGIFRVSCRDEVPFHRAACGQLPGPSHVARVLEVSASGYYAWRTRPESKRAASNRQLLADVRRLQTHYHGRYGSPRMHTALRAEGRSVSRGRIERLMRRHGIRALAGRRFPTMHDRQPPLSRGCPSVAFPPAWLAEAWAAPPNLLVVRASPPPRPAACGWRYYLHFHRRRLALPGRHPRSRHEEDRGRSSPSQRSIRPSAISPPSRPKGRRANPSVHQDGGRSGCSRSHVGLRCRACWSAITSSSAQTAPRSTRIRPCSRSVSLAASVQSWRDGISLTDCVPRLARLPGSAMVKSSPAKRTVVDPLPAVVHAVLIGIPIASRTFSTH